MKLLVMEHACIGPYTSERSNMRTKYSRFRTADSQGMYSFSLRRNHVVFRARVTSTILALKEKLSNVTDQDQFDCVDPQKINPWGTNSINAHLERFKDKTAAIPCQMKCIINELPSIHHWNVLDSNNKTKCSNKCVQYVVYRTCAIHVKKKLKKGGGAYV